MLLTRAVTDDHTLEAVARRVKRRANPALKAYSRSLYLSFLEGSDLEAGRPAGSIRPHPDAALRWIGDGLLKPTATVLLAGIDRVEVMTRPKIAAAVAAGRWPAGAGVAESIVASLIGRPVRSARSIDFGAALGREVLDWVSRSVAGRLIAGQARLDQLMLEALSKLVRGAAKLLSLADLEDALDRVAARFGIQGFEAADATTTFYDSHVVSEQFEGAIVQGFKVTAPIWPYLEYRTQLDERVRESHAALEGFVAQSTWSGWPAVQPPNGWNCRCRLIPVSWQEAEARDWAGLFPVGESQLDEFISLGGAEGFDKGAFTSLGLLVN